MAYLSIKDVLKAIADTINKVDDAGRIYIWPHLMMEPERYWEDLRTTIQREEQSKQTIRAWVIMRASRASEWVGSPASGSVNVTHTFHIHAFQAFTDHPSRYEEFQDLIDRVCQQFEADITLGGVVKLSKPPQVVFFGVRRVGSILCDVADIQLVVKEAVR